MFLLRSLRNVGVGDGDHLEVDVKALRRDVGAQSLADASCGIALLDDQHAAVCGNPVVKAGPVKRFQKTKVDDGRRGQSQSKTASLCFKKQGDRAPVADKESFLSLDETLSSAGGDVGTRFGSYNERGTASGVADHGGPRQCEGIVKHGSQVDHVPRRHQGKAGYSSSPTDIQKAMVGLSVFSHQSGPVDGHDDGMALHSDIFDELVHGSLEEGGIDRRHRPESSCGQARCESQEMSFGDTDVEESVGKVAGKGVELASFHHGGRESHDAGICGGSFSQDVADGSTPAGERRLLGQRGIRSTGDAVKLRRIFFCRSVTAALFRQEMNQHGSVIASGQGQNGLDILQIVPVERAPIADVEFFEKVGGLEKGLDVILDPAEKGFDPLPLRQITAVLLDKGLEPAIAAVGTHPSETLGQTAHLAIDGPFVIIENDNQFRIGRFDIVQGLKGQTVQQRPIADEGDDFMAFSLDVACLGVTQSRREGGAAVPYVEVIERAFSMFRKAGDATPGPEGIEDVVTAREDFIGVGLMSDIEDDAILGGIEKAQETHDKFHGAKRGGQMAPPIENHVDDPLSEFPAECRGLFGREGPQIPVVANGT